MIYKKEDIEGFIDASEGKTLICFGAGANLVKACNGFADVSFFDRIGLIADNDPNKRVFKYDGREIPVHSLENCLALAEKEPIIFITANDCIDIIEQLDNIRDLERCYCYFFGLMRDIVKPYHLQQNRTETESIKIPKIIHYCWFGGKPLRENFKSNIETWKKYCPDYEIVRWDESNYDYKQNEYMYEAYKHKKWGFVSDYARVDTIHRYGGVYFDTDVELIRNIDDLLCDNAFCGFQHRAHINNGSGFGAIAGLPVISEQFGIYDYVTFLNDDGSLNLTSGPTYHTERLRKSGLKLNNVLQVLDGMKVYPSDVLSPKSVFTGQIRCTSNTYSIHHYSATWEDTLYHDKIAARFEKFDVFIKSL